MDLRVLFILMMAGELRWWYRSDARLRRLRHPLPWRILLACFIATQTAYVLLWISTPSWVRSAQNGLPLLLHVSVYLWHLLFMPVICLAMLFSAIRRRVASRTRPKRGGEPAPVPVPAASATPPASGDIADEAPLRGPSRRQLMSAAAVAIPPLLASGVTGRAVAQLREFRVRHLDLPIPGLPPDLDGLTIALVTDLHLGKFTRDGSAARVAEATNALSADLVVFLGDLIDYSRDDLPAGIDFIRSLKPRHGPKCLVMIQGNHDLLEYAPGFEEKIRAAGLPMLIDEARTVHIPGRRTPVQWLGLCWGQPGRLDSNGDSGDERLYMSDETIAASMSRVLPLRSPGVFPILLSHHPHAFDPAAEAGLPLTLSGHTHGGQIMLTDHIGAGPIRFRYWTGTYRKANSRLYVCNGVGSWFPLRINAPAEIVKLTLKQGLR